MNKKIQARLGTQEKRKSQVCKVYQLKLDKSHLSNQRLEHLNLLFLEAKWYHNWVLSHNNLAAVDTRINTIEGVKPTGKEPRELQVLSAQMKQSIHSRIFSNLVALSELKKAGNKVGALRFRSFVRSIPLKQLHRLSGRRAYSDPGH